MQGQLDHNTFFPSPMLPEGTPVHANAARRSAAARAEGPPPWRGSEAKGHQPLIAPAERSSACSQRNCRSASVSRAGDELGGGHGSQGRLWHGRMASLHLEQFQVKECAS